MKSRFLAPLGMTVLLCVLYVPMAHAAKARVQVRLVVASQADAALIRDAIAQFLAGKNLPNCSSNETNRPVAAVEDLQEGAWVVMADFCFAVPLEAENWKETIRQKWSAGPPSIRNRILPGSRVSFHICPHEDGEKAWYSCRSVTLAEFSEVQK